MERLLQQETSELSLLTIRSPYQILSSNNCLLFLNRAWRRVPTLLQQSIVALPPTATKRPGLTSALTGPPDAILSCASLRRCYAQLYAHCGLR